MTDEAVVQAPCKQKDSFQKAHIKGNPNLQKLLPRLHVHIRRLGSCEASLKARKPWRRVLGSGFGASGLHFRVLGLGVRGSSIWGVSVWSGGSEFRSGLFSRRNQNMPLEAKSLTLFFNNRAPKSSNFLR